MEYGLLGVMPSISFDRAAGFYDETRGFPPGISNLVAASAQASLPPRARALECGIGTGRIAIPLIRVGLEVTGIDLSRKMMQRLVESLEISQPKPALIQGDATQLPLKNGYFDAVLMVHVIHLISEWPAAIEEVHRVLKPEGIFLTGYNHHPEGSVDEQVREKWKEIVHRYYQGLLEPGPQRFEQVKAYLSKMGAVLDEWVAARWSKPFHVGQFIESLEQRIYSSSWYIPEDLFQHCIADLRSWAKVEFGSLEFEVMQPHEFIWQRFHWK